MGINIRRPLRKFKPLLLKAREENLNEADTRTRLLKVFEEVLGYDPLEDITMEQQIKEKFVDIALKVDGVIRILVEAKAADTTLKEAHIDQAWLYASQANIPWVLLTNGVLWNLYHLNFGGEGIKYDLALRVDLSKDGLEEAGDLLSVLHRQSVKNRELEEFWAGRAALRPRPIARAIYTEQVLRLIRRRLRQQGSPLVDLKDLADAIQEMFTPDVREQIGPVEIQKTRKRPKAPKEKASEAGKQGADAPAPPPGSNTTAQPIPAPTVTEQA